MKEIPILDRNRCSHWFMKIMGLEWLKALIKRNNSYISRTFWQELVFVCIYPSALPLTFPVFFFYLYTDNRKKAIKSFKDLKLKPKSCHNSDSSAENRNSFLIPEVICWYIFVSHLKVNNMQSIFKS